MAKTKAQTFHQWIEANHAYFCGFIIASILALAKVGNVTASKFIHLQYALNEEGTLFTKGFDDLYFVIFIVSCFLLVRYICHNFIFIPFAMFLGLTKLSKAKKFASVMWEGFYYLTSFTLGYMLIKNESWFFNSTEFFANYPHVEISFEWKFYYLAQMSFWLHLVFVLLIEPWKKDFLPMLSHHFLTIGLIAFSLAMNFTRIGSAIHVNQDFADIFLPLGKALKYLQFETTCNIIFGVFLVTWFVTRHVFYNAILYSIWVTDIPYVYDPSQGSYWTPTIQWAYLITLGLLQILLIYWFVLIARVAVRAVISSEEIDDTRENESSDEEDEPEDKKRQ